MFMLDTMIDTVQQGKKIFVNTFVTNEKVAKTLNEFIDAQTTYTKEATKATSTMFSSVTSETIKSMQENAKFDYTKFGEGIMKAWQSQLLKK